MTDPTPEQQLDGAYRERAHLVALLATLYPSVIAPALDIDEPGWWIAYLTIGGRQASWHIAPRDAGLFARVERVEPDDPRAHWDGHTTDAKYEWLRELTELRAPMSSGPAATQATEAVPPMDADTTEPHTGLVVQPYTVHGERKWVFRCWGTDTCDGWLSLDHYSEQSATRARDRHAAEEHGAPRPTATEATKPVRQTDADPDDPPVQCWHTEADTPCDWDVCKQPERLAAGDYGTDPREQH